MLSALTICSLQLNAVKSAYANLKTQSEAVVRTVRRECAETLSRRSGLDEALAAEAATELGAGRCAAHSRNLVRRLKEKGYYAAPIFTVSRGHMYVAIFVEPTTGKFVRPEQSEFYSLGDFEK